MEAVLERLANERAETLRRAWESMSGQGEEFFVVARDTCGFVHLLSTIWDVMEHRLRAGGMPARLVAKECDLLLELARGVLPRLDRIDQDVRAKALPQPMLDQLTAAVQEAGSTLATLMEAADRLRSQAAGPPEVAVGLEEVLRRTREADENNEWLPLREVVARMRRP